ncbi:hypothetical protein R1sor_021244 [Riccia sorocarpa]|uniref:UTP23 sensor motif region domain-containing protein n=1 Tax=Riccia sorocarpa TaxID=122646 RepID=A0ABD3GGJ6_9MARC
MEPPSSQQIAYALLSEEQRLHMLGAKNYRTKSQTKAEAVNAVDDTPAKSDLTTKEGQPVNKERIRKRKRPKGPNPLSQMKKKEKMSISETNGQSVQQSGIQQLVAVIELETGMSETRG